MYRIYGKTHDMNRFQAIDLNNGNFVVNLIYASFFENLEEAKDTLDHLMEHNKNIKFELRKV